MIAAWILAGLALLVGAPTLLVARGKPRQGSKILAVLGAAMLTFALALGGTISGAVALVGAHADGQAAAVAALVAASVMLAGSLVVGFAAFLAAAWH